MSNEIKSCHICDTPSNRLRKCDTCLHQCCEWCINKHKTDMICQLITEHVNNVSNLCKHHNGRVYTGYCLKCSQQTCERCKDSHADHIKSIMTLKIAMEPIQERLRNCRKVLTEKETDTVKSIHSSTEEFKKLRSVQKDIEDGGMKWERLISYLKDIFLKLISNHMAKLEEFCDKGIAYQARMHDMVAKMDSLENVQYIRTFYPIWLAVIDDLESVDALKKVPKSGSFSIILHNPLPDLSDCLIETREYTDLMSEKELKLGNDALKLGNEIEKSKLATEDLEKIIRENAQLKKDIYKLQGQLAENKLLSQNHQTILVENERLITKIKDLEEQKKEMNESEGLSCVADEKSTSDKPVFMDLGDPNRPMRIGVKYSELYDSEWTNAMENISDVKKYYPDMMESEVQEIIMRHLHRLLKCCYRECLMKAEKQFHTLKETLAETMCLTFKSKDEITSLPVCREAAILRRATSEGFAKHLFQNQILCKNIIADWDYTNKNENVMQIFTQSMFFEKCVYLCWCMVIQDPVLHLDDEQVLNTQIDKNTYEEFDKSGDCVAYVVWPALFLHKGGPLLCKGVVKAHWKKDYET